MCLKFGGKKCGDESVQTEQCIEASWGKNITVWNRNIFQAYTLLDPIYTKPRTKESREEGILVKKDISLKDNSASHCIINYEVYLTSFIYLYVLYIIMINSLISKLNFVWSRIREVSTKADDNELGSGPCTNVFKIFELTVYREVIL